MRKPEIRAQISRIRLEEAPKVRITEEEILADLRYPAPAGAPKAADGKRR